MYQVVLYFFTGQVGFKNLVGGLNEIANQYMNDKYVVSAKHMVYNGQIEYLSYSSILTQTVAPWTVKTTDNSNDAISGGDILYTADTDLAKNVLGKLIATRNDGKATYYWLASRGYYYLSDSYWSFGGRRVDNTGELYGSHLYSYKDGEFINVDYSRSIRPILILNSFITPSSGNGTSDSPYIFS